LSLHESLGGATASQQRKGYTTKNIRGEIRQKKEKSAAKGEFLLFIHFSLRHGTATAPQRERQRIVSQRAQESNGKSDKMGRAASILKSCSIGWNRENAAQFLILSIWVLHDAQA
jgi:hypothetical protein